MAKTAKVKGYGAYWKGDIKNKTIKRKNKQYISDQRCLQVYKKELQKLNEGTAADEATCSNNVNTEAKSTSGHRSNVQTIAEHDVKIIKPQIETVYYVNGAHPRGDANATHYSKRRELSGEGKNSRRKTDGATRDASVAPEVNWSLGGRISESNQESDNESDVIDSESDSGELENDDLQTSAATSDDHGEQTASRSSPSKKGKDKAKARLTDGKSDAKASSTEDKTNKKQKGKFTGVYAKALKLREEKAKIRQQQHNERVEKIKQKKREIREKKQERYARHRLLGQKTKRGQPIMANVISHLMNNFQKKHNQK
ncbi:rRNA processing domain containing protein, putative [Babesia bigemina]|uniref:rRNA processing domain containing protein, putative n=1 Tax=Babesia bigemina TaxID=5866 RepID=A0A061D929_BABBI|nr:rRNA processing domain containing protein, putative [Babesia bigemina]CDR96482.1 rRNA processing domain containing protein, putative [Babesia bigemina]|eukprot:XP_012768668.1 rRNA processing domain containing protein, putative [Babesia bigemina]